MTRQPTGPEIRCTFKDCETKRLDLDSTSNNITYARAAGWHIWSGYTTAGRWADVVLCPTHAGNHKRETVGRPEWDEPLF